MSKGRAYSNGSDGWETLAMSGSSESQNSDAQQIVINAAKKAHEDAAKAPYTYGGNDTSGFDCSGYVIYVFNKAFGDNTLQRVTADALRVGGKFTTEKTPLPGDLVFFSKNKSTASHVGIVLNSDYWIGSQSSTGVAEVKFSNSYWKPLILSYGRYIGMQKSDSLIPLQAGSFPSKIK
ncbi:CHAP domain-containing protein [Rhodovarius crocodyli]|uniref:CHAP domain-containing protein n=1 Tax=Rhodovarius crocodyli TaxID=1979269 RepID=A0A437MDF7_9PROT|nr:NlpC/P60 family protein [Rhodovarius crocodyli]RVT95689.1 CHAP domain-containing protein [Rhodovarius crocodyli]